MYDTDTGAVLVDGHNVRHLTQESLRQHIGVVAQDTILFNASMRDNIVYGKQDATEEQVWGAVRAAALEEFVKGLPQQLDTTVGERGMKLSGGERQRVGLARCIIKDPTIILLDEATSALDSSTEREIQRNIKVICQNRTTIMIAHRLSTARNADEIVVLQKGEIVERGTHDELLQITPTGHYARMWHIQTTGDDQDPVIG
jgi:ABC-type multidrug transport system fused ATPase/permease subunit